MITVDRKVYEMKDAGFQTEKCLWFWNQDDLFEATRRQMFFFEWHDNIELKQKHVGMFNSKILNRQFRPLLRLDNADTCFSFTP